MNQGIHQVKVASVEAQPNKGFERVAFFNEDGEPVEVGGGGAVSWDGVSGKPAVIAAGADAAAARSAIGAGTSSQNLSALTAAQAEAGTETTARAISAKVLADEIDRRVAAALAAAAG